MTLAQVVRKRGFSALLLCFHTMSTKTKACVGYPPKVQELIHKNCAVSEQMPVLKKLLTANPGFSVGRGTA